MATFLDAVPQVPTGGKSQRPHIACLAFSSYNTSMVVTHEARFCSAVHRSNKRTCQGGLAKVDIEDLLRTGNYILHFQSTGDRPADKLVMCPYKTFTSQQRTETFTNMHFKKVQHPLLGWDGVVLDSCSCRLPHVAFMFSPGPDLRLI